MGFLKNFFQNVFQEDVNVATSQGSGSNKSDNSNNTPTMIDITSFSLPLS